MPVTAYFAIVIKSVVFGFFVRIFGYVFYSVAVLWQPLFMIAAIGSIAVGSFGALVQRRIKRFLAYTSINQVGFLLLGLALCDLEGISSAFLFLFIYLLMNIIFFNLILNAKHFIEDNQLIFLSDLYSLAQYDKLFGFI